MSKSSRATSPTALLLVVILTLAFASISSFAPPASAENGGNGGGQVDSLRDTLLVPDPMLRPTGVPTIVYFSAIVDAIF